MDDDDELLACRNVALPVDDSSDVAAAVSPGPSAVDDAVQAIRDNVIGTEEVIATPFGARAVVYCDWTATARALRCVEDYMQTDVLPMYANTHSSSSKTAMQTSCFRHEAREIVQLHCHANPSKDVVLFAGQGATSAINRLVGVLGAALRQAVVFVGPFEHHSNLLPWRESGAKVIGVPARADGLGMDASALVALLREHAPQHRLRIGAFSAASNVTGVLEAVDAVSSVMHRHGGLVFWDYSACAPYVRIDVNPVVLGDDAAFVQKDAVFFSSHKLVGGVGGSGVLVAKKALFSIESAPATVGGGTVLFVDATGHRYLKSRIEREEAGSPNALADIRASLAVQIKQSVGVDAIAALDAEMLRVACEAWAGVSELVVLGPPLHCARLPVFTFLVRFPGGGWLHHNFVACLLNDLFGIQARGGCMCAGPYVQSLLGMDASAVARFDAEMLLNDREHLRPGATRLSLAYFETPAHARFVVGAVKLIAQHGWRLLPMYRYNAPTGEWGHVNGFAKFPARRWLHNANLLQRASRVQLPTTTTLPADFDAVLAQAVDVLLAPLAATSHVVEPDANALRWFALPMDALALLRGAASPTPPPPLVIVPWSPAPCNDAASVAAPPVAPVPRVAPFVAQNATQRQPSSSSSSSRALKHPRHSARRALAATSSTEDDDDDGAHVLLAAESIAWAMSAARALPAVPRELSKQCARASKDWKMLMPNDRVLLGLSGGKDSLCLLHVLLDLQKRAPFRFTVAACTIDPGTDAFDPSPLIPYVKGLGVEYFYERTSIFDDAKKTLPAGSQNYCSFCARMKRGTLYRVARDNGFNVLALAQHLDDFAESFVMSAFRNGQLRTMKACYTEKQESVRVIRPLCYVREKQTKAFSYNGKLPVIPENCPACFQPASERARVKQLLKQEEAANPALFPSLRKTLLPLMGSEAADALLQIGGELRGPAAVECVESCEV